MSEIKLPDEEYIHVVENGHEMTYCTMRQKVLHVIGLDYHRPYTRHGKKFYKPYRNFFSGNDNDMDKLVEAGYMDFEESECGGRSDYRTYWFNRIGLDWLGSQIGVIIHSCQ